jgi:hypothetical protein
MKVAQPLTNTAVRAASADKRRVIGWMFTAMGA